MDQGPALRGAASRTYLTQSDLLRKALEAAPVDDRSKAQWGFALPSGDSTH